MTADVSRNPSVRQQPEVSVRSPLITIFALPKPFNGESNRLQRNALASWTALGDEVQVLIAGDDEGVQEAAAEFGVEYLGGLRKNDNGTPYLDHLFELAHEHADGQFLLYVNADILLFDDALIAAKRLISHQHDEFLAIGRRLDLDYDDELDTTDESWSSSLIDDAQERGNWSSIVCKDYFLFPRTLYREIPAFLVGRGNWDNWMVHQAKQLKIPVIDLSEEILAIHQNHGYGHMGKGRLEAYVTGDEARHNETVGGGKHLISGASAEWSLAESGELRRLRDRWRLLRDTPRFFNLLLSFTRRD